MPGSGPGNPVCSNVRRGADWEYSVGPSVLSEDSMEYDKAREIAAVIAEYIYEEYNIDPDEDIMADLILEAAEEE